MRSLAIPESRAEQIAWLESEIVGTELHVLVAELQAVHGMRADFELDAPTLHAIRDGELAELTNDQFSTLLQNGIQLLSLQRDVLEHGGSYWSQVDAPTDLPGPASFVERSSSNTASTVQYEKQKQKSSPSSNSISSNIVWAVVSSLATAAALLLFVRPPFDDTSIVKSNPVDPPTIENSIETPQNQQIAAAKPAWGFAKFANEINTSEAELDPPLSREAYLRELAAAADAWTAKRPETATALAQRIGEFRMGCSAILMATHGPLPESDRTWLRDRCRSWANALDRHLAEIESGQSVEQVRAAVDSTVTKIAAALLGRADTPTG